MSTLTRPVNIVLVVLISNKAKGSDNAQVVVTMRSQQQCTTQRHNEDEDSCYKQRYSDEEKRDTDWLTKALLTTPEHVSVLKRLVNCPARSSVAKE